MQIAIVPIAVRLYKASHIEAPFSVPVQPLFWWSYARITAFHTVMLYGHILRLILLKKKSIKRSFSVFFLAQ